MEFDPQLETEPEPEPEPERLDPYEKVPRKFKDLFKSWKGRAGKLHPARAEELAGLANLGLKHQDISMSVLWQAFQSFHVPPGLYGSFPLTLPEVPEVPEVEAAGTPRAYHSTRVPGLVIIPSLLPPAIQQELLSRLLHRDLNNPEHNTNLHLHYNVQYPEASSSHRHSSSSFFAGPPERVFFLPKNPAEHKPLTMQQALQKKLRWMTLGGQYDWTKKKYPEEPPPHFPPDIAALIRKLFPGMKPEAAIVNIYSPGDTLGMHRDVSEEVDEGLVSISIGCDAIFVIGLCDHDSGPEGQYEVLRLRSGDAVYMTGRSRLAWHGVPTVVSGTCPGYLEEWPGMEYPSWKGWMQEKRINLNIRQMFKTQLIQSPAFD